MGLEREEEQHKAPEGGNSTNIQGGGSSGERGAMSKRCTSVPGRQQYAGENEAAFAL